MGHFFLTFIWNLEISDPLKMSFFSSQTKFRFYKEKYPKKGQNTTFRSERILL
jgi:hypothetical protein